MQTTRVRRNVVISLSPQEDKDAAWDPTVVQFSREIVSENCRWYNSILFPRSKSHLSSAANSPSIKNVQGTTSHSQFPSAWWVSKRLESVCYTPCPSCLNPEMDRNCALLCRLKISGTTDDHIVSALEGIAQGVGRRKCSIIASCKQLSI